MNPRPVRDTQRESVSKINKQSYDPAIPLLGIYTKYSVFNHRDSCISSIFVAMLLITARKWNLPKCPSTDEWIINIWYTNTMELHSVIKKNKAMIFAGICMKPEKCAFS